MLLHVLLHNLNRVTRKTTERGRTPMFCPVCRDVQYMVASVVTVQRGPDKREHFEEARCPECAIAFGPFQRRDLPTEEGWTGHIEDDIMRLPSRLGTALRARLNLHDAMCDERLSPEQRAWLMREPFLALAHEHADRMAQSHAQKSVSAVVQFLTIVVLFAAAFYWFEYDDAAAGQRLIPLLLALGLSMVTAALIGLVLWRQINWKRMTAKPLVGPIQKMLGPVGPTAVELELVLAELRQQKNTLARGLKTTDLVSL